MSKNANALSFYDFEERAHQLRAEAARDMGVALRAWVKSRFSMGRYAAKGKLA